MAGQFSEKEGKHWKAKFFTIWSGQAFSMLGSQLVQFALIWYLTVSTGSARVLASASLAGMGAGALVLAFAPPHLMPGVVGDAFLVGFMSPITMGPFFAMVQSSVEPGMQARIFSLLSSVGAAMAPLGLMIAGAAADSFGSQSWFMLGGALCILMAAAGVLVPAVVHIEEKRTLKPQAAALSGEHSGLT